MALEITRTAQPFSKRFSQILTLYFTSLGRSYPIILIITLGMTLLQCLAPMMSDPLGAIFIPLSYFALGAVGYPILYFQMNSILLDKSPNLQQAFNFAKPRIGKYMIGVMLFYLSYGAIMLIMFLSGVILPDFLTGLLGFLSIIPFSLIFISSNNLWPILIFGNKDPFTSIKATFKMTWGNMWRNVGLWAVCAILLTIVFWIIFFAAAILFAGAGFGALMMIFLSPSGGAALFSAGLLIASMLLFFNFCLACTVFVFSTAVSITIFHDNRARG